MSTAVFKQTNEGKRHLGTFLGVYTPTILTILGVIMYRKAQGLRVGSVLLALSGVLSIVGLVATGFNIPVLDRGVMVGGFVFMVALVPLVWFFMRQPQTEMVAAGARA